jgi:mRNA-degrading endonuclease toxin of MazEF toxin-antitoxin module
MFPAVALASQAGTVDVTAAVVRDAAGIDPDAARFQAAACVPVEKAAAADRPASVWLPDSGTPDVEASADAVMALPVARTARHSPRLPVAAAAQIPAAQRAALDAARRAVPVPSGAAASASLDAVPRCVDESWAARRDQVPQA